MGRIFEHSTLIGSVDEEPSSKSGGISREGVWALVVAGIVAGTGFVIATQEAAEDSLSKIEDTELCAAENISEESLTLEALTNQELVLEYIASCATENNARIAPAVRLGMVDDVRDLLRDNVNNS